LFIITKCTLIINLKFPYYGIWKVPIFIWVLNMFTGMQDQKTLSLSYNMHLFIGTLQIAQIVIANWNYTQ